jgi:transposase
MVIADKNSLPVSISVGSASPCEVTLVETTLERRFTKTTPALLIGDKAYDSDPLDRTLEETYDIDLIAPHKRNRVKTPTQDGRPLRRYKKRWKVERFNAWIQNFRRVTTRWEYKLENYIGFVHLACLLILLRSN